MGPIANACKHLSNGVSKASNTASSNVGNTAMIKRLMHNSKTNLAVG